MQLGAEAAIGLLAKHRKTTPNISKTTVEPIHDRLVTMLTKTTLGTRFLPDAGCRTAC